MLDRLGIAITSLCALHCILLPALLPVLPILGLSVVGHDSFERVVLISTMVLGFIALFAGFHRYHKRLYPLYTLALGGLVYWHKHTFGDAWEPLVLSVGAALVIAAHYMNWKLCRSCKGCDSLSAG